MKRFWDKVNKTNDCWNWIGGLRGGGYGRFKYLRKNVTAHRMVWLLTYGKFPDKMLLHRCNNRRCVNISHLYEGTAKQNYNDMVKAGTRILPPVIRKLTEKQVKQIRELRKEKVPLRR